MLLSERAGMAPFCGLGDPTWLALLRPESGLYFANADRVREAIRQAAAPSGVTHVILDLGTVPEVDLTAARMLGETPRNCSGTVRP